MPHSIRYDTETQIVEVTNQGTVTLAGFKEIFSEALELAAKNGACPILSNYRGATLALSTVELYNLHKLFEEVATSLGLDPQRLKRALIPSDQPDGFRFFETVSENRGYVNVRVFHDVDDAKRWLTGK